MLADIVSRPEVDVVKKKKLVKLWLSDKSAREHFTFYQASLFTIVPYSFSDANIKIS